MGMSPTCGEPHKTELPAIHGLFYRSFPDPPAASTRTTRPAKRAVTFLGWGFYCDFVRLTTLSSSTWSWKFQERHCFPGCVVLEFFRQPTRAGAHKGHTCGGANDIGLAAAHGLSYRSFAGLFPCACWVHGCHQVHAAGRHAGHPIHQRPAVRAASRSIPPEWGSNRFRPAPRTYDAPHVGPHWASVRGVSQTKSRKIPAPENTTPLPRGQVRHAHPALEGGRRC